MFMCKTCGLISEERDLKMVLKDGVYCACPRCYNIINSDSFYSSLKEVLMIELV